MKAVLMVFGSASRRSGALLMLLGSLLASPAVAAEAERIVSIGGATTEVLYALGEAGHIAAVDSTSLYPPEAQGAHPNIGYMRALSAEGVLSQSPDLILMEKGAGPAEAVAALDQAGIPIVHVPAGYEADGIAGKVRVIASAVGRTREGDALASRIDADLSVLKADLSGVAARKRVLFIYSLVDGRPMAAGRKTAANAIVTLAGGDNVLSDIEGYKTLSWEAAADLQPDVILMGERGGASPDEATVMAVPAIAATPAGRSGAFVKMDTLYLLGFGPRTPDAARDLATRLYPDLSALKR